MKSIPFSGIVLDTSNPQDGQLTAMCNLRHTTTGSIEPTGNPEKVYNITTEHGEPYREIIYIHKTGEYENWISFAGDTLYFEATKINGVITPVKQLDQGGLETDVVGRPFYSGVKKINGVTSIGNTLIFATESEGLIYFLYSLSENDEKSGYNFVTIKESDINVSVYSSCNIEEREYGPFQMSGEIRQSTRPPLTWFNPSGYNTDEFVTRRIQELKNAGYLTNDIIVARWAIKMYDNSYTYHSAPILLMANSPLEFKWVGSDETQGSNVRDTYLKIKDYTVSIKIDIPEIFYNSDIYTGVDLFISVVKYYPNIDVYQNNRLQKNEYAEAFNKDIGEDELSERIYQASIFYKLSEYKFEDFDKSGNRYTKTDNPLIGKTASEISDIFNNLVQQQTLEDDNQIRTINIPNGIYLYNNRIHSYNINTKLYDGYPINMFLSLEKNKDKFIYQYYIKTYIKTNLGDSVVVKSEIFDERTAIPANYLSNYISYPDSRAYKMEIQIIYIYNESFYSYQSEIDLKPHDFLNLSYFIPEEVPEKIEIQGEEIQETPSIPEQKNNIESTPNKIKVSATDNPFVFPVEQTYTVGTGKIIGMAASTPALSQGQYGQFPLYVFTDNGIYMMQVGTGDVIYTNTLPVSRDVCNNPDSIIPLDNAIAFTTERKLLLLSGYSVKSISTSLEADYIPNPGRVYTEPINNVLKEFDIAYNYQFEEIIIKAKESGTAFVYDLRNKIWRQREINAAYFVSSYPETYAISEDDNVYNLSKENKPSQETKNIVIQTAPMYLGAIGFKKIERAILRAIISGNITVSVYGSNDNVSFKKVMETKATGTSLIHDIPIPRISSSWRYFYVYIKGDIGFKSFITRIDIQEKTTFNTKLR